MKKVKVDGREVTVNKVQDGYVLDVPATMSNPADMIDNIYLTSDGGRTFVQASEVIHLTAHPKR
jgi:hypothetical protein